MVFSLKTPEVLSEIILLGSGVLIFLALVFSFVMALASAPPLW
jgi:hypothetical protein